jgi:transglutaminase-like putative cysteine protease
MPTDASFRFSTYLSFALVCATLGYAEIVILPEVAVFALVAVFGLGVLYFLESRVALLSISAANRLGVAILLVYGVWAAYRVTREDEAREFVNMGWHIFIMAMCGPLVMALIVAKVARGDKHAGDYWTLHGIALAGVALAAAFAEEPVCFVLVALYLIAAVWSLTLLHLGRARGAIPPIPGGKQPATKAVAVSADPTGHRTDLRPAVFWAVVAIASAVPLYLLTPRSSADKADFGKPRIEIGYSADQMIDLKNVGQLKANPETAFEVTATGADGAPKTDLKPDQRWRGRWLRLYTNGEWKALDDLRISIRPLARPVHDGAWAPPTLGPGQYTLAFNVPARTRGTFVADPVQWAADQPPQLAAQMDGTNRAWFPQGDGTFLEPSQRGARGTPRAYVQIHRTGPDPDISPPFRFADEGSEQQLEYLRRNPVNRVKDYADDLVRNLIKAGELPEKCRDSVTLRIAPEYQDKLARRFAAHLATTPTLEYTTELRRVKTQVDPIEDFLFHSKAGHCERFATALVLMLRSQGIPAMFVLGFKGCEQTEEGHYIVRQEHAHAWAVALVAKPDEPVNPNDPLTRVYQWRSLDPTPGAAQIADADANRPWWQQANNWVDTRFQEYLSDYTPEQRQKALGDLVAALLRPGVILGVVGVVGAAVAVRYVRRRRARRADAPPISEPARWFGELVALLRAHDIVPALGDTPLEFAVRAGTELRARPGCEPTAAVPLAWAEAYYQDRYGGAPPSEARLAELEAGLDALRRALTGKPTGDRK